MTVPGSIAATAQAITDHGGTAVAAGDLAVPGDRARLLEAAR